MIIFTNSGGKAPAPKTAQLPKDRDAPKNTSVQHPLDELQVIYEADAMWLESRRNFNKRTIITKITIALIRPHWKQIAIVKPAERKECYQLAITHAEKLFEDHGSVEEHQNKRAGTSKQPGKFDPRANRQAEESYHNKYGNEFDTQLAQLLSRGS